MAGFFGIGDYTKEGPGISKDAPKKKAFFNFFETFFRNFWKFISINIVFTIISLPVLTNGLSNAGLTHVARNTARDKHSFGLSDFFETIKKNWKQALIAGIINSVVLGVAIFGVIFYLFLSNDSKFIPFGLGISFSVIFCFSIMNFYLWTLLITFNFSLKQLYSNSFKFVFLNIKNNLLCGFCLLLVYALYISFFFIFSKHWYIIFSLEFLIAMATLPGFRFLLIQYFTFPAIKKFIIDPYYKENPDADIELRRGLGLDVEDETEKSNTEIDYFADREDITE